ncbi:MAG: alpha-L-fucosidase [bacterium]
MNVKQVLVSLLAGIMAMSVRAAEPVEGGNMPKAADVSGKGTNLVATASTYVIPKETREQKDARMKWFREARYGLFIHWGPSAILGTETSWGRKAKSVMDCGPTPPPNGRDEEYDNLYKQFNPVEFSAKKWVKMAKAAGMKYIVFTCKHHDGFCNFHTQFTDYNIANTPFKRDIVKELADACHKAGLRFGVYYSPRDWYQPSYLVDGNKKYLEIFHGHLQELLNNYGKVDIIWFDSMGGDWADWDYPKMAEIILKSQPDILSNGRIGPLQARTARPNFDLTRLAGDFQTPEQVIGKFERGCYWESCTCLVDGQWGYKPDGLLLTLREVMGMLLYSAGGDGNLLLDVAPTPQGNFEERQIDRLKQAGDWLKDYGDTFYGTRGGPYKPGYWGVCTLNGSKIFLHALTFQGDTLTLPSLPVKVLGSKLLTGGKVDVQQTTDALIVKVAPKYQQKIDTIIELTVEGNAFDIKPIDVKDPETLLLGWGKHQKHALAKVTKSDAPARHWWHNPCGPGYMFDNCRLTSWVPDPGASEVVISIDLEKPTAFSTAAIESEGALDRVEIKAKMGTEWKSLGSLEKPNGRQTIPLPATTAQELQLVFTSKAKGKFHVWEFQLFK